MKTIVAFKIFRHRKGRLYPLFIGRGKPVPLGEWVEAECIPTSGFAVRPGWHATMLPMAPQLRTKAGSIAADRCWAEVEIAAEVDWQGCEDRTKRIPVGGCYRFQAACGEWLISGALKVNRVLTDEEVVSILMAAGEHESALAEIHL